MYTKLQQQLEKQWLPVAAITIACLVFTGALRFGLIPQLHQYAQLRRDVAHCKAQMRARMGSDEFKTFLATKHENLVGRLARMGDTLGQQGDLATTVQIVFDRARFAGVQVEKTVPQTQRRSRGYVLYPILLRTTSTYRSLGAFINSIEELRYVFKINKVYIAASENVDVVNAEILVTCYIQDSKKESK